MPITSIISEMCERIVRERLKKYLEGTTFLINYMTLGKYCLPHLAFSVSIKNDRSDKKTGLFLDLKNAIDKVKH